MTYTITVTDDEQEVLAWVVSQVNAEKGTKLTVADYVQSRVPDLIRPFALRHAEALAALVAARYSTADATTKASVRQTLGVTP